MGLAIIILSTGIAYIIPIFFLRSDIAAMKREIVGKLRKLQQAYYLTIIERQVLDFETLKSGNEALDYFDKVCVKVESISNYPHFKRLLKYVGLALTPSIISLAIKFYQNVFPLIDQILRKP